MYGEKPPKHKISNEIWEEKIYAVFEKDPYARYGPQEIAEKLGALMKEHRNPSEPIPRQTVAPHLERMREKGILFVKDGIYGIEPPSTDDQAILEKIFKRIQDLEQQSKRFEVPDKTTLDESTVMGIIKDVDPSLDQAKTAYRMVAERKLIAEKIEGSSRLSVGPVGFVSLQRCAKCHRNIDGNADIVLKSSDGGVTCASCSGKTPAHDTCGYCGLPLSLSPELRVIDILPPLLNDRELAAYQYAFETDNLAYFASKEAFETVQELQKEYFSHRDSDWNSYVLNRILDLLYDGLPQTRKRIGGIQVDDKLKMERLSELAIALWKKIDSVYKEFEQQIMLPIYGQTGLIWTQSDQYPVKCKEKVYYHPACHHKKFHSGEE